MPGSDPRHEALESKHVSRSESEPESASLRKVGAAKLPELEKPAIDGEEAEEAAVEPPGVEGDSARGKGSRGAWETWLGGWEQRSQPQQGINNLRRAWSGVGQVHSS